MRITIRLDDDLLRRAKSHAVENRTDLAQLLDQALREFLSRRKDLAARERVPLPSFRGNGLQPGVDLNDSSALRSIIEDQG